MAVSEAESVPTLEQYLASRRSGALQTAAARFTCAQPGAMGNWSLELQGVDRLNAAQTGANPHGLMTFPPGGWLAVDLDDFQGWHPFIAVAGMDAGRRFQVNIHYGFDETSVLMTSSDADFDPVLGRYVKFGPMSDGTLAAAGRRSRIEFTVLDGEPMRIADCWVGWDQAA